MEAETQYLFEFKCNNKKCLYRMIRIWAAEEEVIFILYEMSGRGVKGE